MTLISALLFYFGYVSRDSQYAYFGIDVDTIGLSTQDYVMRSPQPLLVPLLGITLLAVGGLLLHKAIHAGPARRRTTIRPGRCRRTGARRGRPARLSVHRASSVLRPRRTGR